MESLELILRVQLFSNPQQQVAARIKTQHQKDGGSYVQDDHTDDGRNTSDTTRREHMTMSYGGGGIPGLRREIPEDTNYNERGLVGMK